MPEGIPAEPLSPQSPSADSPQPRGWASRRSAPFLLISVALFLISLSQPAMLLDGSPTGDRWECLVLLCMGWIGVFGGVFAWLANPALAIAWIFLLLRKNRHAAVSLIISLGFALTFLFEKHWERDTSGTNTANITGHGIGYWLWIASIVVALTGALFAMKTDDPNGR